MRCPKILVGAFVFALATSNFVASAQIPIGDGVQTLKPKGIPIEVFTYRPKEVKDGPILFVIHGIDRNPDTYRDNAKVLADRLGMIVVAPHFDKQRFRTDSFQYGGIVEKGLLRPRETWTADLLLELANIIRAAEGNPAQKSYFVGHSAGAQLLSRIAAFSQIGATRIVISNPSSHVFPDLSRQFPYGFGGPTASLGGVEHMKIYLAQPITVFVGKNDLGSEHRDDSQGAVAQGVTRYERSINYYNAGRGLAERNGWPFAWRLVEVPGVGHNAKAMFSSRMAAEAFK